jgi:nucleoside-diphosphate kinase
VGKDFYEPLVNFVISGPVIAMVIEGDNAIALVRKMMGALNPVDALPGTIRGDLTISTRENLVHGSDCLESAEYEIGLWFPG